MQLSFNLLNEVGYRFGNYVCDIVVKRFTFAISSPDERFVFLCCLCFCVGLSFFSTKPEDWLGRTSPK